MELFSLLVRRIPVQSAGNFSVWTAITSSMNLSMRVPAAQQQWRPKSCKTTRASHSTSRKKKHALTGEAWARTSSPVHPEFPGKTCVTSTISLVSSNSATFLFGMWNGLELFYVKSRNHWLVRFAARSERLTLFPRYLSTAASLFRWWPGSTVTFVWKQTE